MLTDQQHPITPPPELVGQWHEQLWGDDCPVETATMAVTYIATQAARWGDGQRLEACCEWLREAKHHGLGDEVGAMLADRLRAAMRPKPPSLAEEALEEIQEVEGAMYSADLGCDFTATRAALKRLQELESNG